MSSTYIRPGYAEIRDRTIDAELIIEDADNSDTDGEPGVVDLVVKEYESGDQVGYLQLTRQGADELVEALLERQKEGWA